MCLGESVFGCVWESMCVFEWYFGVFEYVRDVRVYLEVFGRP